MSRGFPIVVSAASGTGKTSLCRTLLGTLNGVTRSISYTTRRPRGDEVNGRDYYFVPDAEFERMIRDKELIEWAEVFGQKYGTGFSAVEQQLDRGLDVFLDIDVQGGGQISDRFPDALLIFLLPPSMEELRRRLVNRATDSLDQIDRRLSEAQGEIRQSQRYDYLVVNDDFERAAADMRAIITAARLRRGRQQAHVQALLGER